MATSDYTSEIPYGYCHCGCGQKTTISKYDNKAKGHIKNKPRKYVYGHNKTRFRTPEQIATYFWSNVNKDGSIPSHMPHLGQCWEWTAGCAGAGYGEMCAYGKPQLTHRISWQLTNGEIPNELFVLHKCDNRKCVNPSHLFLGTAKDNLDDMITKGRARHNPRRGDNNPSTKISDKQVEEIKKRHAAGGISYAELGREYKVSDVLISMIIKGQHRNTGG